MKLALLGPSDSIDKIIQFSKGLFNDIELVPYEAFALSDSAKVLRQCLLETDGVLCTGPSVYDSVFTQGLAIPIEYVPHNETALYELLATHDIKQYDFLSIDTLKAEVVNECLKEISIDYNLLEHCNGRTDEDYLTFHKKNVSNHSNPLIITTFTPIYTYFSKKNTPVKRLYTSAQSIREQLAKLDFSVRSKKLDNSKIAIQIIKLSLDKERVTQTQNNEKRIDFEQRLLPYVRQVEGSFFSYGRNEYILFSTKGQIMSSDAHKLFYQLILSETYHINSGIGIGYTASLAEINANKAIDYSIQSEEASLYSMDECGVMIGPILENNCLALETQSNDNFVVEVANSTGLSINYIKKLYGLIKSTDKEIFSSEDIAALLNISKRSSRRILKQLIDGGYAVIVDKEMILSSGRPQNLIKILL